MVRFPFDDLFNRIELKPWSSATTEPIQEQYSHLHIYRFLTLIASGHVLQNKMQHICICHFLSRSVYIFFTFKNILYLEVYMHVLSNAIMACIFTPLINEVTSLGHCCHVWGPELELPGPNILRPIRSSQNAGQYHYLSQLISSNMHYHVVAI